MNYLFKCVFVCLSIALGEERKEPWWIVIVVTDQFKIEKFFKEPTNTNTIGFFDEGPLPINGNAFMRWMVFVIYLNYLMHKLLAIWMSALIILWSKMEGLQDRVHQPPVWREGWPFIPDWWRILHKVFLNFLGWEVFNGSFTLTNAYVSISCCTRHLVE